jgi:hypothetical protein
MFDLEIGKYRLRELTRDPLPMDQLNYTNPREEMAQQLVKQNKIELNKRIQQTNDWELYGTSEKQKTQVQLDPDGRISTAQCSCYFYKQNRLMQGPCEHMLALLHIHQNS